MRLLFFREDNKRIIKLSAMLSKSSTKYIQSLHQKKYRDADNTFIAEGSKVVLELLQSGHIACKEILGLQSWLHQHEPLIRKHFSGPLHIVSDFELEKISLLSTPNQVLAVFFKPAPATFSPVAKITLALDQVQDPGNLGTIIRIADWFGIEAIICSLHCADMYNPKVVQGTMGSLGRVKILYCNLPEWLQQYKNIPVYATALNGQNVQTIKGIKEGILIIGNESKGISEEVMQLATQKITIPKFGAAESLNAAVAAGIILSHL